MEYSPTRRQVLAVIGATATLGRLPVTGGQRGDARTQSGTLAYVSTDDGTLHAVEAASGERRWTAEGVAETAPTVVDGTVYVGSSNGSVHALDATTGETDWTFGGGSGRVTSPTVVYGSVYVGTRDESLYAIDAATGEQQWSYATDMEHLSPIYSAPNVVDGAVYFGTHHATSNSWYPSTVHALDARSGDERWVFDAPEEPVDASPVAHDGTVYAASMDERLYAIDAASGEERWHYEEPTNQTFPGSPVVVEDTVYARSRGTNLHAIDASTGSHRWTFSELLETSAAAPTVVDGVAYVDQHAIDATTGERVWSFETEVESFSSPTVLDETVYVGGRDGQLFAVAAESGTVQWTYDTGAELWTAPTVVPDPSGGHSEGSRVGLGTVGHHHSWAGAEPTSAETATPTPTTTRTAGDGESNPPDRSGDTGGSGIDPSPVWLAPAALGLLGVGGAVWAFSRRSDDGGAHDDTPQEAAASDGTKRNTHRRSRSRTPADQAETASAAGSATCSECGGTNDPDARFCQHCGTGISTPCPSCGTALTGDEVFCPTCGDRLQ